MNLAIDSLPDAAHGVVDPYAGDYFLAGAWRYQHGLPGPLSVLVAYSELGTSRSLHTVVLHRKGERTGNTILPTHN